MFHATTQRTRHIVRSQSKFVPLRPSTSTSLPHRVRKTICRHHTSPALRQRQLHNHPVLEQHPRGEGEQPQPQPPPPPPISTVNDDEISHFSRLSALWWDERGEFALLHKMNPHRIRFIREKVLQVLQTQPSDATATATLNTVSSYPTRSFESIEGMDVLDVGCGGGILSEVRSSIYSRNFRLIDAHRSSILLIFHIAIESRASRRQYAGYRRIGGEHRHRDASCRCGPYLRARCHVGVGIWDTHVPAYNC